MLEAHSTGAHLSTGEPVTSQPSYERKEERFPELVLTSAHGEDSSLKTLFQLFVLEI